MADITGTRQEVLAQVQTIVERHVPGVVCELQNYRTEIGCGALHERGTLYEVKWGLRGLTEYKVEDQARALASRFQPRMTLLRRG